MNQKIKDALGVAIIIGVLLTGYSALRYANTFDRSIDPASTRNFSVSAKEKVVVIPDIAEFSFSVITEGDSASLKKIQEDNAEKTNQISKFLKSQGIDEKDIKTTQYNISPKYERCFASPGTTCPPPSIIGYEVSQATSVKIRDFTKIGDTLTRLVKEGADSTSGLSFSMNDPKIPEAEAREKAIKEAQEKAKDIAKTTGFRLGRLLSISESNTNPPVFFARTLEASSAASPTPSIEPGSQEVEVIVTLKYEIR